MVYFLPWRQSVSSGIVVSINHVRNDLHALRRCHATVSVRLEKIIEGTDWCKLRVIVHIKVASYGIRVQRVFVRQGLICVT